MDKHLKILMLEDFEEDADLIQMNLRRQGVTYTAKVVDNREEFIEALESFCPDVILSDHLLPQLDSDEALEICQERGVEVPFILVTGTVSEEFAVLSLKRGASDYILKSNLTRLSTAIKSALHQKEVEFKRREAEESLKRQNQELMKINSELDSFVYRVSHNLRSPLTSVLGLIQITRLGNLTEDELSNYLSLMEKSILRLDSTIKDILDYSQNTRKEIEVKEVDLEKLAQETVNQFRYYEGFAKAEISIQVDNGVPFYSDPFRVNVILGSLVSNAVKFVDLTTKPKPHIDIVSRIDKEKALIKVEDNGVGIEKENIGRVFEMFFKTSQKGAGAGLGLYIVKEAVEKLGGTVSLVSERGRGTTVTVEIPNMIKGG